MRGLATPNYNGGPTDALLADFIRQVEKKGFEPSEMERRIARRVHAMHQDVAEQFSHAQGSLSADGCAKRKLRAEKAFEAAKALLSTHMPESGRSKESQDGAHDAMIEILAGALGRQFEALTGQALEDLPSSEDMQKECIVAQLSDGSKGTSSCDDDHQCPITVLPTNTFPFDLCSHDLVSVANEVFALDREASRLNPHRIRCNDEQGTNSFLVTRLGLMVSAGKNIVRAISHNAKLGFLLGYSTYANTKPAVRGELLNLSRDAGTSGESYDYVIVSE